MKHLWGFNFRPVSLHRLIIPCMLASCDNKREILFTMISKNIYKNYKILKKIEKYIKMSNKNLRKTNGYTLRLGLLLELKKGEDNKTIITIIMAK